MRKVKVERDNLLKEIKANKIKHKAEYEDAVKDYKLVAIEHVKEAMQKLEREINELKDGQVIALRHVSFNLAVPEDHTKDYDQVIKMLEMSVDKELEIQTDEFACYVMDDWDWKDQFRNTAGLMKTAAMNYVGSSR